MKKKEKKLAEHLIEKIDPLDEIIAGWNLKEIKESIVEAMDVKDTSWIDGQTIGISNIWIDLEEPFAVFYKDDLINFYNKIKEDILNDSKTKSND